MSKARRYPFPKASKAVDLYKRLSIAVALEELPLLRRKTTETLQQIKRYEGSLLGPSLQRATELAQRCHFLLDSYAARTKQEQAMIAGVVKYFITKADATRDDTPIVGFDDDVMIMNSVLEELRIFDRFLE